jgi:hypothetical protein
LPGVHLLPQPRAIEAGADFLAESFTFGIAASIVLYEQYRSRRDAARRKDFVDESLTNLESNQKRLDHLAGDLASIKESIAGMKKTNVLIAEGLARLANAEKVNTMVLERVEKVIGLQNLFEGSDPKQLVINLEPGSTSSPALKPSDSPDYLQNLNASLGIGRREPVIVAPRGLASEESEALSLVVG